MKKVALIFCITVFCSELFSQKLVFEKYSYDFGNIKEVDGVVGYEFSFTNKNTKAYIDKIVSPIGSLRVNYSRNILSKKQTGKIIVSFNPAGTNGAFSHDIAVFAVEKKDTLKYILNIKGNVEKKAVSIPEQYPMKEGNLRYKTNHINMQLTPTTVYRDTFYFFNEDNKTMTFETRNIPAAVKIIYLTPSLQPNEGGILVFDYSAKIKNDWGTIWDKITVVTNDSLRPNKSLHVNGKIFDDYSNWTEKELANAPKIEFSEEEYHFGTVTEGENVEHVFTIFNKGKSTLYLRKLKPSCSCTMAKPEKDVLEPGDSTTVKVIFMTARKNGSQVRTMDIISNDPQRPSSTLKMVGKVNPK